MQRKFILAIILLVIFSLTIFPFIIDYCLTDTHSKIGFVDEASINGWIGYYGAVTGGALTLGGVIISIGHKDIVRKNEVKLQYLPIIDTHINNKPSLYTKDSVFFGIVFKNVGRGEIYIDDIVTFCNENEIQIFC